MIIEFVGLPGAGKTTTCLTFAETCRIEGATLRPCTSATFGQSATSHLPYLRRKLVAVGRILGSFLRHPRTCFLFLSYGLSSRPFRLWKIEQAFSGISMLPRLEEEQRSPRASSEILLFEQGVVQLLGSIALPGEAAAVPDPRALCGAVLPGRIDGLVMVDCTRDMALERLRSRSPSRSRFNEWADDDALDNLSVMQPVLEAAVSAATAAGVPVLRLDSTQPLEANCALVKDWILALRQQAAGDKG